MEVPGPFPLLRDAAPAGAAPKPMLRLLAQGRRATPCLAAGSARVGVWRGRWALCFASAAPRSAVVPFKRTTPRDLPVVPVVHLVVGAEMYLAGGAPRGRA